MSIRPKAQLGGIQSYRCESKIEYAPIEIHVLSEQGDINWLVANPGVFLTAYQASPAKV